jgi:Uma2 family endonuclease
MIAMLEKKVALGNVIARDVTFDNYMKYFAQDFAEWIGGMVIKMSPVAREHDLMTQFLIHLLRVFLAETRIGLLMTAPFVMKITPKSPAREPDLHIVLKERAEIVQRTMTAGAADVAIEIISEDSEERDTEEKFAEYQAGGVREYWLFDPLKREAEFYLLDEKGQYQQVELYAGIFSSSVLQNSRLHTSVLWQEPLPMGKQIDAVVEAMLKKDA